MHAMGEFELQLLFALLAETGGSHGVAIADRLERETRRRPSPGAIHKTMDRLERRGFVASRLGDPTPVRGGRRRRHYRLTGAGARALRDSYKQLTQLARGRQARLDLLAQTDL